jgi:CHAD domain-containing protein
MRTRRQIVLRDGAEIVEDAVSVFDGRRVVKRFRELEVELLDGDKRSLRRLERRLLKAGAELAEFRPKLFRALDLSPDPGPDELAADTPPGAALGHALVVQHRQLVDHDPGTRLGTDPEDLHQMRVATRRARAFLRAARDIVEPEWAEGLRTELGWLGSLLGPARDADVLYEHLSAALAGLGEDTAAHQAPLLRALERERSRARRSAVTALSRKRYFALLDRLEQAGRPPLVAESDARLADLWWDEFKRTRKAFAVMDDDSPDDELHAARIRVKRARYSAELAAHELGARGERFVSAAKKLQDVLGEHQDAVVAEEWLTRFGDASPESEEVVARLVAQERKRRRKARRGWPDAWERLLRRARQARR